MIICPIPPGIFALIWGHWFYTTGDALRFTVMADPEDMISSCVHAAIQPSDSLHGEASPATSNYSRISIDEMDIDKMFDKTAIERADNDDDNS